jgi:tetratricopeptide (TPR) repeat protein
MNDLSNFSQFHPSWEGRDFSREEFASLLDDLTKKKSNETLITNGKTIQVANIATQIWQKIKGWLGLENQTDPIRVNYDLLKLLRYGETHHFFSDAHIKGLIEKLLVILNQDADHSYLKVTELIKSIFPLEDTAQAARLVDREIQIYYGEHKKQLHVAFWENVFHKYITPVHQTTANFYFNEANIAYVEGNFEKALEDINKALVINPVNNLWMLKKANILLDYSKYSNTKDGLTLKLRALDILTSIPKKEEEDISLTGLNNLLIDTLNNLASAPLEQKNLDHIYIKLYELTGKIEISDTIHAINIGEKIAVQRPDDWQVFYELSRLYQIIRNYPIAYKCLEKSYILNPQQVEKQGLIDLHHLAFFEDDKSLAQEENEFVTSPVIPIEKSFSQSESFYLNNPEPILEPEKLSSLEPKLQEEEKVIESNSSSVDKSKFSSEIEEQHALANSHVDKKNFIEALPIFEKLNLQEKIYECLIGTAEQEENTAPENAIEYYKKALNLMPNQNNPRIHLEIARLYEVVGDLSSAIEKYQQLNLPSKIYACWTTLAHQANENKAYEKAIDFYEKAFAYATTPAAQQALAVELLPIACFLIKLKENNQAKKASLLAIQSLHEPSKISQKDLYKVYMFLAKCTPEHEYPTISKYLQKALEIRPNEVGLILMKAELDKAHENDEKAIIGFEKAILLEPQKTYHKDKLIAAELAAGDKYYRKGLHHPQKIQEDIVDLMSEIKQADYGKKITRALGSWLGEKSSENRELVGLGKNAETPQQIAKEGLRACELLEKAYDGQANHMTPKEMPKTISNIIKKIRNSIFLMNEYYETLQKKTNELVLEIKTSPLSEKFLTWDSLPKIKDLKNAKYVEEQAQKCLYIINDALQKNPSAATSAVKQLVENLHQLSKPYGWINNAIYYYKKVLIHDNQYGQYCNNLIDAYTKIGDYANAIQTYENLKIKFPENPLFIDYKIYAYLAGDENSQIKLSSQQLVEGILKAADQFSREESYDDSIHSYLLALNKAEDMKQTAGIALRLLDLGDKLINTNNKDLAIKAYKNALSHQIALISTGRLKSDRLFKTLLSLAEAERDNKSYDHAINYYEEAYKIKEDHEIVNASLGSLYLEQNQPKKALNYLEKAHQINPANTNYLNQIANAENGFADECYAAGMTLHLRQSLINLVKFVTIDAPYAENIKNALGATWGRYSTQNKTLRDLGKFSDSAKQLEADAQIAISLLETAYDGEGYHNKPEDFPSDLAARLEAFKDQLQHIQASMKDHPQLYRKNISTNTLEDQTQKAILFYEKAAVRFPEVYNDNYNRLIDAYFLKGEAIKALKLYNQLKVKFPTSLLYINPLVYSQTFDSLLAEKKHKEAYELINIGLKEYPDNLSIRRRLSSLYYTLGQEKFLQNDFNSAVRLYTLATKCGVDANAECYVNLAKIYMLSELERAKINYNVANSKKSIYPLNIPPYIQNPETNKNEYPTYFQAAVANLKKAADILPNDAELRFQLTRMVYHSIEDIGFDIVPYIEQAAFLEPTNASYAYANMMTQRNSPQKVRLLKNFKDAGGKIVGVDDAAYWTLHNPRGFPL